MKQLQVGEMSTAYRFILKKSLKIPKGNQNRYPYIEEERVNLVINPVISHELGKDGKCLRQVEHIRGHL